MSNNVGSKITTFFEQYPKRKYKKGQVLIFANDELEDIFYITEGLVKQYDITNRGDEIILNIFKSPAFFPMSVAINKTPNPYVYEAETEVSVHVAPVEAALVFVQDNPDVLFDLLSRLYIGIDGLLGRLTHLMASTARGRLMFEIVIVSRRQGKALRNGRYEITISERELGARAGLSRETVSREMTKLIKESLVTLEKGALTVIDIEKFETKLSEVM